MLDLEQAWEGRLNMDVLNLYDYPRMANAIAYEEMKEALEQEHWGKWVVIDSSELFGAYQTYEEADEAAGAAGLDFSEYFIRQVGVMPAIILSHGG